MNLKTFIFLPADPWVPMNRLPVSILLVLCILAGVSPIAAEIIAVPIGDTLPLS